MDLDDVFSLIIASLIVISFIIIGIFVDYGITGIIEIVTQVMNNQPIHVNSYELAGIIVILIIIIQTIMLTCDNRN